jgi:hypothetical protein
MSGSLVVLLFLNAAVFITFFIGNFFYFKPGQIFNDLIAKGQKRIQAINGLAELV